MTSAEERYVKQLRPDVLADLVEHSVGQLLGRIEFAEKNWAEFERRYNSEVKRTNFREERLHAIRRLHTPRESIEDGVVTQRCTHCVAGYDPRTEKPVQALWPCETKKLADGRNLDE